MTSSSSNDKAIDISSSYFLSSTDHTVLNVISDNRLSDGNYKDWVNVMTNSLHAKNKFAFVAGSFLKLEDGSKDIMNSKRFNVMVRGWLVSYIEKEIKIF